MHQANVPRQDAELVGVVQLSRAILLARRICIRIHLCCGCGMDRGTNTCVGVCSGGSAAENPCITAISHAAAVFVRTHGALLLRCDEGSARVDMNTYA